MTDRQRDEMQQRRFEVFQRDGWSCRAQTQDGPCLMPSAQLAHRIPQTKANLRKYGAAVIHHPLNLVAVCSLACNDSVLIGGKPVEREALVGRIEDELREARDAFDHLAEYRNKYHAHLRKIERDTS